MTLAELATFPTTLCLEDRRFHESLTRSFHVLQKARAWLLLGTPPPPWCWR